MTKKKIKIDIVSDIVCPWCFIGKRRLEKAMTAMADEFEFDVHYLPFELNPTIPAAGLDQKAYLADKFGGTERYEKLTGHVTRMAAAEGLNFDFQRQRISPNTRQAHRLVWFAQEQGKGDQVQELLMKAYFEDGVDLSRSSNLAELAAKAGMDQAEVQRFLGSTEGEAEVEAAEKFSFQRGVQGVPFFIINDQFGISGAQSPEVFKQALTEIGSTSVDGENCIVDQPC